MKSTMARNDKVIPSYFLGWGRGDIIGYILCCVLQE
jgi:hypothetical protein